VALKAVTRDGKGPLMKSNRG